jgi:hypothetical protein
VWVDDKLVVLEVAVTLPDPSAVVYFYI